MINGYFVERADEHTFYCLLPQRLEFITNNGQVELINFDVDGDAVSLLGNNFTFNSNLDLKMQEIQRVFFTFFKEP